MNIPTTFHAHGQDWFHHTPGDPMPCEPDAFVDILMRAETSGNREYYADPQPANEWGWGIRQSNTEIIGWRYASSDQPKVEPTELERMREENRLMRDALKEAHSTLTQIYNHGRGSEVLPAQPDDHPESSWVVNFTATTNALLKLQPFIKP